MVLEVKQPHSVKDIIKNNEAEMIHCIGSKLIYKIKVEDYTYEFPIDVSNKEEVGDSIFNLKEKAIYFMRYINKAIKGNELKWYKE